MIIIPTGQTKDDLRPAVQLAHSMVDAGIDPSRIVFALVKTTRSTAEVFVELTAVEPGVEPAERTGVAAASSDIGPVQEPPPRCGASCGLLEYEPNLTGSERGLRPSPYSVFLHESCRYPSAARRLVERRARWAQPAGMGRGTRASRA